MAPTPTHQVSIPAMVVLVSFLLLMATLAIGVILRQRKAIATFKDKDAPSEVRATQSWVSRLWHSSTHKAAPVTSDNPTAVGALHATAALLAAAPCHVFSSPMSMHYRIPLQDKTVLILGAPWFPSHCGAQYCGQVTNIPDVYQQLRSHA